LAAQVSIGTDNLPSLSTAQQSCSVGAPEGFTVGEASADPQVWDFTMLADTGLADISFIPVAGTDADTVFTNSEFARTSPLSSLLGIDITQILPLELNAATAYYVTDADGNVAIDGVSVDSVYIAALDIWIPLAILDSEPNWQFWSAGDYGDDFDTQGIFTLFYDLELTDIPLPGFVYASVDFQTNVAIDAYGCLELPSGATEEVLRYHEVTTATAYVNLVNLDANGEITDTIFPEPIVDTMIVTTTDRFYSDDYDYPIASVNSSELGGEVTINSVEYLKLNATEPDVIELTVTANDDDYCETGCVTLTATVTGTDSDVTLTAPDLDFMDGVATVCLTEDMSYTIVASAEGACDVSVDQVLFDVIVPECTDTFVCVANAGNLSANSEFACGGAVTLSNTGANANYALIYIMTDADLNIIDLNTDGSFSGLSAGSYLPHNLSIPVEDVPADPSALIGANAADVLATLDCFDLVTGDAIAALDPMGVTVDYACDPDEATYTLTVSFTGGLPALDGSFYTSSGELSGEFAAGEETVLTFSENAPYSITVSDNSTCSSVTESGSPDPCSKVAIELISFEGRTAAANNVLSWSTGSEDNNDRFELYRSVNGVDFEMIATLDGAGNSNVVNNYNFIDKDINTAFYYQLVNVSFDAETEKSDIIFIGREEGITVTDVYPNPANSIVNIDISATTSSRVEVSIFALSGALVQTVELEIADGSASYPVDVQALAGGVYILNVSDQNGVYQQKITVE